MKNTVFKEAQGEYYFSYNPSNEAYGNETTAIVIGRMRAFYILNGNHQHELSKRSQAGGLRACAEYFFENIDMINSFSQRASCVEELLVHAKHLVEQH